MRSVVVGEGKQLPQALGASPVIDPSMLAGLPRQYLDPDLVVIEDPAEYPFLSVLAGVRSRYRSGHTVLCAWSARPDSRSEFICHNVGIHLLGSGECATPELLEAAVELARSLKPASSMKPSFDQSFFRYGLYSSIGSACSGADEWRDVYVHLVHCFSFISEPDLLVFMLHGKPEGSIKYFSGSDATEGDLDYFLQFCRQDFLKTNRYVNVITMAREFIGGNTVPARKAEARAICSYWHSDLVDRSGNRIGTVHAGSYRNRYFTAAIESRLEDLCVFAGPVIGDALDRTNLDIRYTGLRTLFSKFLPEPVLETLLADGTPGNQGDGRSAKKTVLFSDIRGFTTITESNGAEAVVRFLNRHFDAMVQPIHEAGGTVDKFIGDAIVAIFDDCASAVKAALDMTAALATVEQDGLVLDGSRYRIGIGLHYGDLILGYLGSEEKIAYTVVGETIRIAEDLEAATKAYGVNILLSEFLRKQVDDVRFRFESAGIENENTPGAFEVFTVSLEKAEP